MATEFTAMLMTTAPVVQYQPKSVPNNLRNHQGSNNIRASVGGSNPNGDSLVDLEYEKQLTTINYDRMKESVRKNHATKVNGQYLTCGEACCQFNTGSHGCIGSSEKSDLTKFGVGIILYFKFVKHLLFFFGLFTLVSIPAYIFYVSAFSAYSAGNKDSLSYIDLLTSTTLGSVGFGSTSCAVRKYPTTEPTTDKDSIYLQCPTGVIASIENVVYGLVATGTTCNFIDTNDLILTCNNYDSSTALSTALANCIGQQECSITTFSTIFKPTTDATCNAAYYKSLNVYMKVACDSNTITVFNKYEIYKSTVAYIVAGVDAGIILVFLLMIYTLKFAQKKATENVQKRAYSASSYTVELRNLPQTMPAEELAAKLWTFLDAKLGENAVKAGHRVVDVQIVLPNKLIEYSKRVGTLTHTKNNLIRDFMEEFVPNYTKKVISSSELENIMKDMTQKGDLRTKKALKMYKKIKDLSFKKMKTLEEIQKLKTTKQKIVSAFVTFSSIPSRDRILDSFISSPMDRLARVLCSSCYDKDISFHGKILRARTSPDPGSILWENLGEPGSKVFARRAFSGLITVCLWVLSAVILIVSTYYKNSFKKSFPTIDCTDRNYTADEAATDYLLGEYQIGKLQCYCQADIINRLDDQFSLASNQTLCLTWFTDKVIETSITLGIVFVVLVINYFVQFVFHGLSNFEKHSTLNKQLAQRVLKTFVAQFLNTGLMILLVNVKIDVWFWQGQFRDITPLWYENVGSTLLSTMFINVVTVPSIKIIFVLFNRIARLCDRKCGSDERVTRKKTQAAYEELYSGPEFIIDFRYSQMLTLTFVCFLYSSGMPLLYFSTFLQLLITYFFDKIFLLRISKLPKNYDESLEKVVRPTMYIILVAHLIFAIFMFGNSEIFSQSVSQFASVTASVSSVASNISNDSANIVTKFFKRTVLDFNFVLSVVLVLILALFLIKGVLLGVLRKTVFALFTKDEEKTHKTGRKVAPNMLANFTFFHVLKDEDIANLIRLTKVTLKSTQNPELISQLNSKLELLKQEYQIKKGGARQPNNFIGFYSYDVRLQPRYAAQFAIQEMLDDENLY